MESLNDFLQGINQFHLIRPYWLLALLPAFALFILLLRQKLAQSRWQGIIDEDLMPHVLEQQASSQSRWPLWFLLLAWVLTSIAMAGPSWKQLPQPVLKKESALVIVLDMSLSMAAQDLKPERSVRAKQKVIDILKERTEGETALITYAGEAFVVTPLTDDMDTVSNLIPSLSPFIMPALGSRPDKAIEKAQQLLIDTGKHSGKILLMTDGIIKKDIKRIKKVLNPKFDLSVMAIGTEDGAPVSLPEKGFLRDNSGAIVLPKLDLDPIKDLASELDIRWYPMSYEDKDWEYLLADESESVDESEEESRSFDQWSDAGYTLIAFIILIALFSFRCGWMLSIALVVGLQSENTLAEESFGWKDLWQTKDQQAAELYNTQPSKAAELFEDKAWQGSSYYRAKDYGNSLQSFGEIDNKTAQDHYNHGNALAQSSNLDQAIEAYEQALKLDPKMKDAQFNKELIEKLKEQQEQDQQQDSDQDQQDESDQNESEQKDSDSDSQDQQQDSQQNQQQNSSDQDGSGQDQDSDQKESQNKNSDQEESEEDQESEAQQSEKSEEEQESEELSQAQKDKEANEEEDGKESIPPHSQQASNLTPEQQQALEQWLNRVPDDPGGLLKRKFLYQYNQQQEHSEEEVLW